MIKTFFLLCLITLVLAVPVALITKSSWEVYLDQTPPQVSILTGDSRLGVGGAGAKLELIISDQSPGLDEVVVRLRQLRSDRELFRKKLEGVEESSLSVMISGEQGLISEGSGEIEVVAFDRSFYNNKGSAGTKVFVDTHPPTLDVLSTQHNLRQGGSQLVVYKARDENLAFSGVRVGDKLFKGFPASEVDSSLNKSGLFVALYSVPVGSTVKAEDLRVRAVDVGGNSVEQPFYNKVARRTFRTLTPNNSRLVAWLATLSHADFPEVPSEQVAEEKEKGAAIDASTLVQSFQRVNGTAVLAFADKLNVSTKSGIETGNSFVFTGLSEARALHSGEVVAVKNSEGLQDVLIDHGLGLNTLYKGLKNVLISEGLQVKQGDLLGNVDTYLSITTLISGTAVDPTEWWSQDWVSAHIYEKLQEVKKGLGIVVE